MDTLKGIATLWPAAGRGWELINGCRPAAFNANVNVNRKHFARANSVIDSGLHDGRPSPYPANPAQRLLSHSRSLSYMKAERRVEPGSYTPSPLMDDQHVSFHQPSQLYQNSMFSPALPAASLSRPFNQQPNQPNPSTPGWGGAGDTSFVRSAFNNNPPSSRHSHSASVGSQRELGQQVNANQGAPMPHFWSDPFTDSTLLASNYYGLPVMDRQTQIAIDQNLHTGFGQADFAPFGGGNF
jgi:hypothetical protein